MAKKVDGVVEAVRYRDGQIEVVRAYERRGAAFSDRLLLTRKEWTQLVLAAVERGTMQASEIPIAERERLRQEAERMQSATRQILMMAKASGRPEVLAKFRGALAVTHHGRTEVINAICRAAFLGQLDPEGMAEALADFNSDFVSGHLRQADILWRAALNRAAELSQRHTPRLGTRSLDVLHVASALELKLSHFLTFDVWQRQIAAEAGLKLLR